MTARIRSRDGSLVFTVPDDVAVVSVDGKTGTWLRSRLASGNYGSVPPADPATIPVILAPVVKALAVQSTLESGPLPPEHLVSRGALTSLSIDPRLSSPVEVFPSPDVGGP